MDKTTKSHQDAKIESFRKDPSYAAAYLDTVLADGDQEEILLTVRYMTKAFGGIHTIAEKSDLNRNTLYRTLSNQGNPSLSSLSAILRTMGMRLSVQPIK